MDSLATWLSSALQSHSPLALLAALLWGVGSVLLSPCHLGTIPLIVAYVGNSEAGQRPARGRAWAVSASFAGGMLLSLLILGAGVITAGWAVAGQGPLGSYAVATILVLAGLNLIGLLPLPLEGLKVKTSSRRGALAAAGLGLIFGLGLSPCTFAFMAPALALSFGAAATHPMHGATLLLLFGVGHAAVLTLAGASAGWVQRTLEWNQSSRGLSFFKIACGLLLLAGASTVIYAA